jgi:preprotein translocase SecF subunit
VGGTILHYNVGSNVADSDIAEIRGIVSEIIGSGDFSVTSLGSPVHEVRIQTREDINTEKREEIFLTIAARYGMSENDILLSDNVNPTVGEDLTRRTILSVLIAAVLMLIYISFRFEWRSGLATVICLVFDLFVMLTVYSLLQISMNVAVIAAFLTILGYSILTVCAKIVTVCPRKRIFRSSIPA